MTIAVIYARVSTDAQETEGVSLESQEASCRAYCQAKGYSVARVYREARSGTLLRERLELMELLEAARQGQVQRVVVHSVDRITRGDVNLWGYLQVELGQYGATIESATEQLDNSPIGQVVQTLHAWKAGTERSSIVERIGRGRDWRLARGELATGGPNLYGYRRDESKHKRVAYEPEAAIVRRIFEQYAAGGSLRSICRSLSAEGIATPKPSAVHAAWSAATLRRILRNPAYKGETIALKGGGSGHKSTLSRGLRLPEGTTPPLVDAQTWERAQGRLDTNTGAATRNDRHPALLRGHIYCGVCGQRMIVASSGQRRNLYYRCRQQERTFTHCGNTLAPAASADALAWEWAWRHITDTGWLTERVRAIMAGDDSERIARALDAARQQLATVEREAERLLTLYLQDTGFDVTLLAERNRQLQARKSALLGEIASLEASGRDRAARAGRAERFAETCREFARVAAAAEWQDKRDIIEALGTRATWTRGELSFADPAF